jgi:hypothetical protein
VGRALTFSAVLQDFFDTLTRGERGSVCYCYVNELDEPRPADR